MAITLQTTKFNVIYVYSRDAHPGLLKIGKTSVDAYDVTELVPNCDKLNQAAYDRFKEAVTYGITDLKLLHTEVAHFIGADGMAHMFDDHAVHEILINSNFERADLSSDLGTPDEWFRVTLPDAVKAIGAVKAELVKIDGPKIVPPEHPVIVFREEQEKAINLTVSHFGNGGKKMLWNAKMRFGKTLCALETINRLDVKKVMILTHRPTVRSGWFDDYHLIDFKKEFQYGSKNGKPGNHLYDKKNYPKEYVEGKDLKTLQDDLANSGTRYIYFASMQDLRGREKNEKDEYIWKDNNKLVYDTEWDLIIFDEAHEGTQTSLGQQVAKDLFKRNDSLKLYLSGTPYNIMSQFEEDEIFTWDYVMEQTAKAEWSKQHPNEPNPYEGLAQLHIYTYSLGEIFNNYPDLKSEDDYFNFAEFFRVWSGDEEKDGKPMPTGVKAGAFIHEDEVNAFLDLLCREEPVSYYPYSNTDFRNALSHTLWMLPGVEQANRLAYLINHHKLHTQFGFEVVSVAGEGYAIDTAGDNAKAIEKQEKDALMRVLAAVNTHPKTITLSCGRLTTGVSVPQWTGVFMLSGGYSTSAANYMQTIFRGQTPYKNGAIKTNCYAFDFAPDRTLTVVNDFIKQQPSSKNKQRTPGDDVERIDSSLRFMPVISMVGGVEVEYNAKTFIERVNKAYTDHVVSHGFKSRRLFKNFANFRPEDHKLLDQIGKLIGGGKGVKVEDGMIVMADEGLTGAKGTRGTSTGKNGNKKDSGEPKTKKQKNTDADQRRRSQNVLDYIFVRLPLLLFGAVTNPTGLTIDELLSDDIIDQESWNEFMPPKFTKAMFRQLSHLIAVDVLVSSTAEIVKMAKKADELPIQQRIVEMARIVSRFHFPDKETVLTPWRVVNMHMTDTLGGYDFYDDQHQRLLEDLRLVEQGDITTNVFCNPDTRILELNSKSGVYPLWLACTLWKLQRHSSMDDKQDWNLWKSILENNLFVVCKTRMAEKITRRVLVGYRNDIHVNTVSFEDIIERIKDKEKQKNLIKAICSPETYGNQNIKVMIAFNAIVGNPPYQVMDGGTDRGAVPVYQHFVLLAENITANYISMIMPARWYAGGRGLDDFRKHMLENKRLQYLYDYETSKDLFPTVDIAGGLCYFLWNRHYDDKCNVINVNGNIMAKSKRYLNDFDIFVRSNVGIPILTKIKKESSEFLKNLVLSINPFGFRTYFRGNEKGASSDVKVLTSKGWSYVKRDQIKKGTEYVDKYKIIVGRFVPSNGEIGVRPGEGYRVITTPRILGPQEINTETYIDTAVFDTLQEAQNYKTYLCTKFARFMLRLGISSVNVTRECFTFVPTQDFNEEWTDEKLYAKYGLDKEEKNLIDSMIRSIE